MTKTQQEIRQRVLAMACSKPQHEQPKDCVTPVRSLTVFLGVIVLLLSVASVWMLLGRSPRPQQPPQTMHHRPQTMQQSPVTPPQNADSIDKINQRLDAIDARITAWATRVWLLGVVQNENANLNQTVQSGQGVRDPGYLYFDENWKLNRMPQTLEMSEEQRKSLQQHVK